MVLASLEEDAERVLREKAPDLPLRARSQAGVRVSRWMDRRAVHGAYVRLRGLTLAATSPGGRGGHGVPPP